MEVLFIAAFAIAFVFLLKFSGRTRHERFLDQMPGPKGYPIVGNFFDIFQTRRDFLQLCVENRAKFGCIYKSWIGSTPIVFISKPEYVEAILGTKGMVRQITESSLLMKSLKMHPFSCPRKRNIVASAIDKKKPDSIIKITNDHCQILLNELKLKSNEDGIVKYETISLCLLDTICEFILGVKVNSQLGENLIFAISIMQLIKLSEKNHKLRFYKDSLFRLTTYGKEYFHYLNIIQNFIYKIIKEREEKTRMRNIESNDITDATSILDDLLIYKGIYTSEDIQHEILNLIISAFQSINSCVYSLLCVIGSYPIAQDKILHETHEILPKNQQNIITIKHIQKMLYLDKVVKETLRLFPPCPFIVKELERDTKIGNYFIPYGTTICIQLLSLQRDTDLFPKNENFDPDNFSSRSAASKNRFSFIPFGTIDSNCLGQKPTEIIQRIILINLIKSFSIESIQQSNEHFTSIDNYIKQLNYEIKLRLILRSNLKIN